MSGLSKLNASANEQSFARIRVKQNTRSIFKIGGSSGNVVESQASGSGILKGSACAPFSRARLWVFNRGAKPITTIEAAIAATDDPSNATIAQAYHPRRAGVSSNVLAADTSAAVSGWRKFTFNGGTAIGQMPVAEGSGLAAGYSPLGSYQAISDVQVSDWVPIRSVVQTGSNQNDTKPFFLLRVKLGGGPYDGISVTNVSSGGAWTNIAAGDITNDFSLLPAAIPSGTGQMPYIAIEFDHDLSVRNFLGVGDSNTEGYQWPALAIGDISTPSAPYNFVNIGMSTHRMVEYTQYALQVLKKTKGITDVLLPSHSTNDGSALKTGNFTTFGVDTYRNQVLDFIDICNQAGIKVWLWTHFYGINFPNTNDFQLVDHNNWCRSICRQGKAQLVDIALNWNKDTMLGADSTHFKDPEGIAYARSQFLAALRGEIK